MISILFEAALRSLFVGLIVAMCLRAFRIRNVFAQKAALGLVLLCAIAMPLLIPVAERLELAPPMATILLPSRSMTLLEELQTRILATSGSRNVSRPIAAPTPNAESPQARDFSGPGLDDSSTPPAGEADSSGAPRTHEKREPVNGVAADEAKQPSARSRVVRFSPAALVFVAYLAIAVLLLLRLAFGMAISFRLWLTAAPIRSLKLTEARTHHLRASTRVSSPLTIGSAVLLPADYETWDEEKLRVVLAHERSHIRQGDFYLQVLASLYAALVWFSPLGWWLKSELADLSEAISDLAGIEQARTRTSYAEVLLEFAAAPRPSALGVAMARSGSLARRIERLLNDHVFRQSFAGQRRALVAAILVPVAFLAIAMVRVQAASPSPSSALASVGPVGSRAVLHNADASPQPETPSTDPETARSDASPIRLTAVAVANTQSESGTMSFDRTLSAGGDTHLVVATGSGNIHLTRSSGSQVHIRGQIHLNDDGSEDQARQIAANPPVQQTGNEIRVGQQHEEHWRGISIDYQIEAPESIHLEATSGSGSIVDEGVGQNAKLETGSGDIQANSLQGPFVLKTGSGNITAEQTGEGDVRAETGSGNIEIKDVHGSFHAQTGSGDIKATGKPSATWTLETGSGNIEIWSGNTPVTLEGSTGSGSVTSDHEMMVKGSFDQHHITGTLNGGGALVHVETGSGDIHVH